MKKTTLVRILVTILMFVGGFAVYGKSTELERKWQHSKIKIYGADQYIIMAGRAQIGCTMYVWPDSAELIAQIDPKDNTAQHLYRTGGYQVSVGGRLVPPGDAIGTNILDPVKERCHSRLEYLPDSTKGQLRKLGLKVS